MSASCPHDPKMVLMSKLAVVTVADGGAPGDSGEGSRGP